MKSNPGSRPTAGFSTAELIGGLLLFSAATSGLLCVGRGLRLHEQATLSTSAQNAYATFQSQMALQGINPALVGNPLQAAINQPGTSGTIVPLGSGTSAQIVRQKVAAFELGAVSLPTGAQRSLAGSALVSAVNYNPAPAGAEATRGAGIGFAIAVAGPPVQANAIPLAPPVFNIRGDLTTAVFPLNEIATLPSSNPAGTTYRYTTDGTAPTATSPLWDNDPGWTPASFPAQVALAAFNTDPQYAPSQSVTASYSMQLVVTYGRADGRSLNLYGFTLADLASPEATGIVFSENAPNFTILYTLDGTDPTTSPTAATYGGAFIPPQGLFSTTVGLTFAAISTDPRIASSTVSTVSLSSVTVPMQAPSFITSNTQPLSPGAAVVISFPGNDGAPRTEVNNGAPTTSSSQATSFPLN